MSKDQPDKRRESPKAWGDDVALLGPDAPKNDGSIKHMIEYLLTVYERFGNTCITANLQWGATALWKQDELRKRVVELEAELETARSATPLKTGAVYLVEGKPHRFCDCPLREGKCPLGVERQLATTDLSRCLVQALDVMVSTDGAAKT